MSSINAPAMLSFNPGPCGGWEIRLPLADHRAQGGQISWSSAYGPFATDKQARDFAREQGFYVQVVSYQSGTRVSKRDVVFGEDRGIIHGTVREMSPWDRFEGEIAIVQWDEPGTVPCREFVGWTDHPDAVLPLAVPRPE